LDEQVITISGSAGPALAARLGLVDSPRGGLVVCHPHPLYGGDMDNPVVVRAAEVAREVGLSTLRFNFRGVGGSAGDHDEGRGEQDDVRAALATLRAALPERSLGLAGYSFGAWVSSRVAESAADLDALCLIAPPVKMFDFDALTPGGRDLLVVAGTRDPYCPVADLDRLAARLPQGSVARIEAADHFFFGKLFPLGEAIRHWVETWIGRVTDARAGVGPASPSPPTG
jgi:alpha/beta superfamily hydrolase